MDAGKESTRKARHSAKMAARCVRDVTTVIKKNEHVVGIQAVSVYYGGPRAAYRHAATFYK